MPELPKKSYYRVDEVALYFDISVKTIYGLIQEGKIEAIKPAFSRTIRISRLEVEKMKRPVIE
jgi:excisionase family DNA binding protein